MNWEEKYMGFSLHDYQAQAKDFLITHPKAGLFLDVGFGKTLTTLAALLYLSLPEPRSRKGSLLHDPFP